MKNKKLWYSLITLMGALLTPTAYSANRVVNLTVAYKTVNFAGQTRQAIAINNQIPGPTLHFKQGETVTINVFNHLNEETAIHWHGLLVPWQMDGVLGVTQRGIKPGKSFKYQFKLMQSGTYWYHSHAGLQEQQGLYGALIIDPPTQPAYQYDKDFAAVLSDWSNTPPNQILANLKKDGDYYAPDFPLQASLYRFIQDYRRARGHAKQAVVNDYKAMQHMRMGLYDLSDVAYDAFLLNGHNKQHPWIALVKRGDTVRLRFIGAGAITIFKIKIPGTKMQVVHVQGNDIKPYYIDQFSLAPGETWDVLVKITKDDPYYIYAQPIDHSDAIYGALITKAQQHLDFDSITPFPDPLPTTRVMMDNMMAPMDHAPKPVIVSKPKMQREHMQMDHSGMESMHMAHKHIVTKSMPNMAMSSDSMTSMQHSGHSMEMATEPTIIGDHFEKTKSINFNTTATTKYQPLKAAVITNDPNKSIDGVINMELFGYMDRYIWFINGVPEHKAKPIVLQPNKRYRFVFTNTSMMNHPMHLHGHWFILRKGDGAYDPLLHTIDVPPGATITADIDTEASGQWLFHCHFLYHMMAGMARTVQYSTLLELEHHQIMPEDIVKQTNYINRAIVRVDEVRPIDKALVHHPMAHPDSIWMATSLDIGINPLTQYEVVTLKGLYGKDYDKLELFMNDAEVHQGRVQNADLDIFYWHLLDQFWAAKGGINYFYRPTQSPYWLPGIGIEGLMPYFIKTDVRGYLYSGSAKLDAEFTRDTQITNNFFIGLSVRSILASKSLARAEIGSGLNQMQYTLHPYYRLMPGFSVFADFEHDQYYRAYRQYQLANGDGSTENVLTFGISVLF